MCERQTSVQAVVRTIAKDQLTQGSELQHAPVVEQHPPRRPGGARGIHDLQCLICLARYMWQAYIWSLQTSIEAVPTTTGRLQSSRFTRAQHVDNAYVWELRQHG